ncbi:hypothetical protein [Metarhizobium album]|uniref:hypothetical protein n=1 Tax=Metarhizobium album TaxID=2182425 RepID=UPI000FFED799|nr:hypothetical protein [Rhizobium album]
MEDRWACRVVRCDDGGRFISIAGGGDTANIVAALRHGTRMIFGPQLQLNKGFETVLRGVSGKGDCRRRAILCPPAHFQSQENAMPDLHCCNAIFPLLPIGRLRYKKLIEAATPPPNAARSD